MPESRLLSVSTKYAKQDGYKKSYCHFRNNESFYESQSLDEAHIFSIKITFDGDFFLMFKTFF